MTRPTFILISLDAMREQEFSARDLEDEELGWGFADYPATETICQSDICREPRRPPFIEMDGEVICRTCFRLIYDPEDQVWDDGDGEGA